MNLGSELCLLRRINSLTFLYLQYLLHGFFGALCLSSFGSSNCSFSCSCFIKMVKQTKLHTIMKDPTTTLTKHMEVWQNSIALVSASTYLLIITELCTDESNNIGSKNISISPVPRTPFLNVICQLA